MKKSLLLLLIAIGILNVSATNLTQQKLDRWRFALTGDSVALMPGYDDSSWHIVTLPHDWSIEGPYSADAPMGNDGGYLPDGTGIYRCFISHDSHKPATGTRLYLEGAYMNPEVWVNGVKTASHPYGYASFFNDITPYLHDGDDNLIAIKVDNSMQKNCRWYSGSGLYRNVYLSKYARCETEPWSMAVTTPEITDSAATVKVDFNILNHTGSSQNATLHFIIFNPGNKPTDHYEKLELTPAQVTPYSVTIPVKNPALWSPESPETCGVLVNISLEGAPESESDVTVATFGFRKFEYSAEDGLRLNGKPITLNGACVHHDNGILGAASYPTAERRKVQWLKDAGFNAVRTSHNPPSEAFLRACDEIGLVVIDEAFDGWKDAKNPHDYSTLFDQWAVTDVTDMVRRDRNHPSIMTWSIGNEIIERKSPEAVTRARMLADACRRADPTRPVTSALASWDSDWEIYDPLAAEHDIVGYNYMIHKAESDHERVPSRVMWQTESYPRDAFSNWVMTVDHPYIIGDFVWTGIDYLGESGIGRFYYEGQTPGEHFERNHWPWHGAYCGDIDLIGTRKPISHYRQALHDTVPTISIAVREPDGYHGHIKETMWSVYPTWDSWTWPGHEGKDIDIEVISRHPIVRLNVNGAVIGEQKMNRDNGYRAVFTVPYQPGSIYAEAIGADGKTVIETTPKLNTAGAPAAIMLKTDTYAQGGDTSPIFVTATIVDANGNPVPEANNEIRFSANGIANVIASGSGDLTDTVPYTSPARRAWKGRAQCAVAFPNSASDTTFTITATSEGLPTATIEYRTPVLLR